MLASLHISGYSGVITGIVKGTATLGHIFAWRNPNADAAVDILRVFWEWETVAGFTTGQEVGFSLYKATMTGIHSTGTVVAPYPLSDVAPPVALESECKISDTAALTANGTPVLDTRWNSASFSELNASTSVHRGLIFREYLPPPQKKWLFGLNDGLIISPDVAMGAGGTGRLHVEIDYDLRF